MKAVEALVAPTLPRTTKALEEYRAGKIARDEEFAWARTDAAVRRIEDLEQEAQDAVRRAFLEDTAGTNCWDVVRTKPLSWFERLVSDERGDIDPGVPPAQPLAAEPAETAQTQDARRP